jgi:SAM-dependent methyltransferase
MRETFKKGDVVLEVGCGSGTETLSLARAGLTVIATDLSSRMLDIVRAKASRQGLSNQVITIHVRAPDLVKKVRDLGYLKLDGGYSTYGAVNTEPNLPLLFESFHNLLKPTAPLVLGVWNRYCAYEILGYSLRGKPSLAFARFKNPVPVGKSRFCVASNSFSASSLDRLLVPNFRRTRLLGVVIAIAPSNLTKYLPGSKNSVSFLKKVDSNLGKIFPTNRLGDHFLAVYKNS